MPDKEPDKPHRPPSNKDAPYQEPIPIKPELPPKPPDRYPSPPRTDPGGFNRAEDPRQGR